MSASTTVEGEKMTPATISKLRNRAEKELRKQRKPQKSKDSVTKSGAETERLLHELQVHHVELEMQNTELMEARDRMEAQLEKYTDFYDFSPVGYMSLDENGQIMEVNLTGAALLGIDRSRLLKRRLSSLVTPSCRLVFLDFLKRLFDKPGKQICEATLSKADGTSFWADFHGSSAASFSGAEKWCRVALSDITALKRAEEAQSRLDELAVSNEELRQEVVRRREGEKSLKKSEQHQIRLLEQSRFMQEQLRDLSRQVLNVQEEERKRISRELHDVIAQTLTGINIRLATLRKGTTINPKEFSRNLSLTQKLVEKSVDVVHRFARELRPAVLDDLGLIPALHAFMKGFAEQTGVRTHLKAFAGVEKLDTARKTVFFRVAQEALTNVAKHSQASRVEVEIRQLPGGINMKIHDDGKAFNMEQIMDANGGKRLGLLGMKERLEMVGGTFRVTSIAKKGTTIEAGLPLGKARVKKGT